MTPNEVTIITEYARPVEGRFTHKVTTPVLRHGIKVETLEDARAVAAGYNRLNPPVEIIERLRTAPAPLKESVKIPL